MRISVWSSDVFSSDLPTLIDRGSVLTDSAVIIEYLNEAFHGPPDLMPINAVIRAQARAWCRRLDSTDALRVITFQQRALPAFAALAPDQFEKIAAAHPTRSSWYRMMGQGGFDANTIETAHTTIRGIFADAAAMQIGRAQSDLQSL